MALNGISGSFEGFTVAFKSGQVQESCRSRGIPEGLRGTSRGFRGFQRTSGMLKRVSGTFQEVSWSFMVALGEISGRF